MYERIVVPLDGSELAEAALPHALHMAKLIGAPIHLVRIVDTSVAGRYDSFGLSAGYLPAVEVFDVDRQNALDYLETMQERYATGGVEVTFEQRVGQVPREIVAATTVHDLVVMTSHGRGGAARWFMGSVAEEVTRHSTVPVLLIRLTESELKRQRSGLKLVGAPAM
jgi:nucleotide-binding universal stress UspA family protein